MVKVLSSVIDNAQSLDELFPWKRGDEGPLQPLDREDLIKASKVAAGVLGAAVLGSIMSSSVRAGASSAALTIIPRVAIGIALKKAQKIEEEEESFKVYEAKFVRNPFHSFIINPVIEEVVFRLLLQGIILPAMIKDLDLPVESRTASIALASLVFGTLHTGASLQAVPATIGGGFSGYLYEEYGILSSISEHVVNNAFVGFLRSLEAFF